MGVDLSKLVAIPPKGKRTILSMKLLKDGETYQIETGSSSIIVPVDFIIKAKFGKDSSGKLWIDFN